MRLQWCKRRQIAPKKGDWQMMLATGSVHSGRFGDRTLHPSPWAKIAADQWSLMLMFKVSWRCWELSSRKCFLDFLSWKEYKDVAIDTGILKTVLQQCISSGPGEESWVCTSLLAVSNRVVLSFPAKPLLPSSYWRTPVPSQKPSCLPSPL